MGAKRKSGVISSTDEVKIVKAAEPEMEVADQVNADGETVPAEAAAEPEKKKREHNRSAKYKAVRAQIDRTKKYDVFAGVELLKKLSYTKFDGTITAHIVLREVGATASLALPHSTGKTLRVAIVDDALLKEIEAGTINFDILVAAPQFMPKLAKFAPVLGPKGLMPNPKNGTLTPNPEAQKKKLEAGTITIKTEKKAPLMHVQIGKVSMGTKELVENVEALIKAVGTKIERMTLAASMSPGVKINVG
jgi:large subunit ribosomal protein L1